MSQPPADTVAEFWAVGTTALTVAAAARDAREAARARVHSQPALRYSNQPVARAPRVAAVSTTRANARLAASSTSSASSADKPAAIAQVEWGADWAECKVGHYAVVHLTFEDTGLSGLGVCKIKRILDGPDHQFEGRFYTSPRSERDIRLLTAKWSPGRREEVVDKWQVICYFQSFTSSRSLRATTRNAVKAHVLTTRMLESDADSGSDSE